MSRNLWYVVKILQVVIAKRLLFLNCNNKLFNMYDIQSIKQKMHVHRM